MIEACYLIVNNYLMFILQQILIKAYRIEVNSIILWSIITLLLKMCHLVSLWLRLIVVFQNDILDFKLHLYPFFPDPSLSLVCRHEP
jgi:hypothetical protein